MAITSVGNPMVWWPAAVALLVVIWAAIRRDWRAWAILSGYLAMYAPWFLYLDRTIFQFYAVAFLPFVCLALAFGLGYISGLMRPLRAKNRFATTVDIDWDLQSSSLPVQDAELDLRSKEEDVVVSRDSALERGIVVTQPAVIEPIWGYPGEFLPTRPTRTQNYGLAVFAGAILLAAIFWMPIWWATPVPRSFWQLHIWLPSWI